jgi:hypothetical protein
MAMMSSQNQEKGSSRLSLHRPLRSEIARGRESVGATAGGFGGGRHHGC